MRFGDIEIDERMRMVRRSGVEVKLTFKEYELLVALARRNGAFLFVHTPEDEPARRIEDIIARCDPVYARRYLPMAIERLIEPPPNTHKEPVDTNSPDTGAPIVDR